MKKKILIGVGLVFLFALIIFVWAYFTVKPDADKISDFVKKHPDKAAIYIVRNDTVIADQNSDTIMPLASTVKIIIAIEFARQATAGIIKLDEDIDTLELDKYYLKGTDGNAHETWLKQIKKDTLIKGSKVKLLEVAKGMIRFSSNANTEFLMDKLGFDNLNAQLDTLGLKGHHKFYPFNSSLVLCQKPMDMEIKPFIEKLDLMPMDEYIKKSFEAHDKFKNDQTFKKKFDAESIYIDQQKIWSNRMIGGSCKQYVSVMQKINSRTYFDSVTQIILDDVFEWPMKNKENKSNFKHLGMKGGSTAFVLTESLYARDFQNNQTAIALFFNNLTTLESIKLQASSDEFMLKVLKDVEFRKKLTEKFKK
jgi:D-alanyl-D-alanine carboxypeptidase